MTGKYYFCAAVFKNVDSGMTSWLNCSVYCEDGLFSLKEVQNEEELVVISFCEISKEQDDKFCKEYPIETEGGKP